VPRYSEMELVVEGAEAEVQEPVPVVAEAIEG
jgi:hypothetical protein